MFQKYDGQFDLNGDSYFYIVFDVKIHEYKHGEKYTKYVHVYDKKGDNMELLLLYGDKIEVFPTGGGI